MRVVFMGTPDFALPTLFKLKESGYEIVLTVTQPDRPSGRKMELNKSPVKKGAESMRIPVISTERLSKDEAAKERIRKADPDVIVVAAFGQLIPLDVLSIPRYGCINVHASLLPRYRGASPIQWAILNGDEETGITTMMMDKGLDTGDILLQSVVKLDGSETGGSLFDTLSNEGANLLIKTLDLLKKGELPRRKQTDEGVVKVGVLSREMGLIDWNESAFTIERKVRALNPWPSAYTFLSGKRFTIWKASVKLSEFGEGYKFDEEKYPEEMRFIGAFSEKDVGKNADNMGYSDLYDKMFGKPGSIYSYGKRLLVQTGEGILELIEIQREGKKRIDAESFLRGYRFR